MTKTTGKWSRSWLKYRKSDQLRFLQLAKHSHSLSIRIVLASLVAYGLSVYLVRFLINMLNKDPPRKQNDKKVDGSTIAVYIV